MGAESLVAYVNGAHVSKHRARMAVFDFGFLHASRRCELALPE